MNAATARIHACVSEQEARARLLDAQRTLTLLERRNRLFKAALALIAVTFVAAGVLAVGPFDWDTVTAQSFVLTDVRARRLAELSTDSYTKRDNRLVYSPRLILFGADEKPRVTACFKQALGPDLPEYVGSAQLVFTAGNGGKRAAIETPTFRSRDEAMFKFYRHGTPVVSFGVNSDQSSLLGMAGPDGHSSLEFLAMNSMRVHELRMRKGTAQGPTNVSLGTGNGLLLDVRHSGAYWGRVWIYLEREGQADPGSGHAVVTDHVKHPRTHAAH
jgi:hypothetical protein